jgi:acetyl esterase/lipase
MYLGNHDSRDPQVSPLFSDTVGLPPVRIHVGEDEVLLDDSRRYAERVAAQAGEVQLHIWEGMTHVFPSSVGTLAASKMALDDLGAFLYLTLR